MVSLGRKDVKQIAYANGHVFISAGNVVLVYDGMTLVKTITGQPGAYGLAVSADEQELYVADSAASRIGVIDTNTLTQTTSYATAACPVYLARGSARLVYSYECGFTQDAAGIGSVSLADGMDNQIITSLPWSLNYLPPVISAAGNHLAAISVGITPATIATFTYSGNSFVLQATYSGSTGRGISLSPDGTAVAFGQMGPYGATVLNFSDLGPNNQMTTGPYPTVVAWSHSGSQLAVGVDASYGPATLDVFSMPNAVLQAASWNQLPYQYFAPVSVAFSSDDSVVYSLMTESTQSQDAVFTATRTSGATATPTPTGSPSPTITAPPPPPPVPTDFPPVTDLGVVSGRQLVVAHGYEFISAGNTVLVYQGLSLVTTLYGHPGALGLAASADGSQVYVADSAARRIDIIDTTSLSQVGQYTSDDCPQFIAVSTARLIYSHGCATFAYGIASMNLADGSDNQDLPLKQGDNLTASPARVAAVGDHVALSGYSSDISTYVVNGNQLTLQARCSCAYGPVAISPDGKVVAAGAITVLNFADLSPNNAMPNEGGGSDSLAFSHSGNLIVEGLSARTNAVSAAIFDLPDGILQAQSSTPEPGTTYSQLNAIATAFTPDDSGVYLLLQSSYGSETYLTLASTTAGAYPSPTPTPSPTQSPSTSPSPSPTYTPSPTPTDTPTPTPTYTPSPTATPTGTPTPSARHLTIRAVGASSPGKALQVTATLQGEPGVQIRFQTHDVTPYVTTIVATTDAQGVAYAAIPVTHSGYVTATAAATGILPAASLSAYYEVRAALTLSSARPMTKSGTVSIYRKSAEVRLTAHARPTGVSYIDVRLYRKINGKWVLRLENTLKTNALGDAVVRLPKLLKNHLYREVLYVGPTAKNAASPMQTFTFEVRS